MESKILNKTSIFNPLNVGDVTPISVLNNSFNPNTDYVELHIKPLNSDSLIKSHYDYKRYSLSKSYGSINNTFPEVQIDPIDDVESYGYASGEYTLYYNFFRKIFSSDLLKYFFVKEISSSRTEVRVASNTLTNDEISTNFELLQNKIKSLSYMYPFVLNLGSNIICQGLDIALDTSENNYSLIILLDDPIPTDISINKECWILESISLSTKYDVSLVNVLDIDPSELIKGPNFNIDVDVSNSYTTKYLNTTDLNDSITNNSGFDNSFDTIFVNSDSLNNESQNSLAKLLYNQKNYNVNINIDFTNFSNFVHFSSIEDRIINFVNKVKSIEFIDSKLTELSPLSNTVQGKLDIKKLTDEKLSIIKLFDKYEYFLYFENSDEAYPKFNSQKPYTLYSTSSPQFLLWYSSILDNAKEYDINNYDYIWKALPEYIKNDSRHTNLKLYVDGLGHYYDNIWVYIKSVTDVYDASNSLSRGISKDLVKDMLVSFGVTLYNNTDETELYDDIVGNNLGELTIGNIGIISQQDYDKEIYKRLYHNLPALLKSKGTEKSVRTLLSIYGIPSELLTPTSNLSSFPSNVPVLDKLSTHAIKVGSTQGYVSNPWKITSGSLTPNTIRFNVFQNNSTGVLFTVNTTNTASILNITVSIVGNTYRYTVSGFSTSNYIDVPINDLSSSIYLVHNNSNNLRLVVVNNNILFGTSIVISTSDWNNISNEFVTTLGQTLVGTAYINSYRHYSKALTNDTMLLQHKTPLSLSGNDPFVSELIYNNDLGINNTMLDMYKSSVSAGSYVNYINILSTFDGSLNITKYKPYTNFNTTSNTVIFGKIYHNNVVTGVYVDKSWTRYNSLTIDAISTNYVNKVVNNTHKNIERVSNVVDIKDNIILSDISQHISYSNDTMLDISISRSKDINKDIVNYLAALDINSYFANPSDMYEESYSQVPELRKAYFANNYIKYSTNDYIVLAKYIKTSLYKMIRDFVPFGSNVLTGVSIQPLLTDRNKYQYKNNNNQVLEETKNGHIGNVNISGDISDMSVDIPVDHIISNVGNNKYTNTLIPYNIQEFILSNDNPLYGNISDNKIYQPKLSGRTGCLLYELVNTWSVESQYAKVVLCGSDIETTIEVFPESIRHICCRYDPIPLPSNAWQAGHQMTINAVNRYGCTLDVTIPEVAKPIEYQEYYDNLSSHTLPRYVGSKVTSKEINVWNEGDKSYGKTAALDSYVSQVGLFTRAYSGSIGRSYTNLTMKYLVDSEGSFVELNELNKNIFDIQNIFKLGDTATISLFNPFKYSNQKNSNGIKKIFSSGYYFKPIFYYNNDDTSIQFETDEEDMYSRFVATTNGAVLTSKSPSVVIEHKPKINSQNTYDIFNIFDKVLVNSFNSYQIGDPNTGRFPSYTIIDDSMKYSFDASLSLFIDFGTLYKTPLKYSLEVVKSVSNEQTVNDPVVSTQVVSIFPGYKVEYQEKLYTSSIQGAVKDLGRTTIIDNPMYDDENNITIPAGTYSVFGVSSEYLFPEGTTFYSVYGDKYLFFYITYLGRYYKIGQTLKNALFQWLNINLIPDRFLQSSLQYNTYILRTISIKTPWITDLNVGNSIYFRLRKLDTNPTNSEVLFFGGSANVNIEIDDSTGGAVPVIESVKFTDTLVFNKSVSNYYGLTQTSNNEELISKYGYIEGAFNITSGDVITIKHSDSTKVHTYFVKDVYINNDGKLTIKLDKNLPANIIYSPENISELVISSRTIDETNIILSFKKSDGETSYGLLIPKHIHPDFMNNIDKITKQIDQKLLTENVIY